MPIAINGSGTLTGVSVGGLPDGIVDTDMIANNAVTAAKATGVGFTPEADAYRLTAQFSGSADPITSNWERNDSAWEGTGYLGASLITQSSGIFTFAKTGWYYFYLQHDSQIAGGNSDGFNQFFASISTNSGGAYTNFCENDAWFGDNASSKYMVKSSSALIKVADASTYRIKISQSAGSSSTTTKGSSTKLRTGFILLRIGDA
tara:strand:- start:253 stop:864 length:612 start_codon:yes stop_codon:yes gene_type:complete